MGVAWLLLALSLLFVMPAFSGSGPSEPRDAPETVETKGCLRPSAGAGAPMPEETDLKDALTHYAILRGCTQGRPPVLTIDLVQYYEGSQAIREAARDGQTLEPDVDPVIYVRNENPKLRHLGVKLDAQVLMFDCATAGCLPKPVLLEELPWNELYRFRLQNGLIVYIELPYMP
jgi:hypothetical protein